MNTRYVWLIAGLAVAFGCTDSLGPGLTGRWAAPGIELQAKSGRVELRMPCVAPYRSPRLKVIPADRIEFVGQMNNLWYKFDFTFRGRFVGDTLSATLTRTVPGHDPSVTDYQMTPDGDSGLDRIVCAL